MIKSASRYKQVSDFLLSNNGLIKEGYPFNLKVENKPVPDGTYIYSAEKDVFREVNTGQEAKSYQVINGRNLVEVTIEPEIQTASKKHIEKILRNQSISSVGKGIRQETNVRALSPQEVAELESASLKADHQQGKALSRLLSESNKVLTRKTLSIDVESLVDPASDSILPENVFSTGIAQSVDTTYGPESNLWQPTDTIRKSSSLVSSFFDIRKTRKLIRQSLRSGSLEDKAIYGKQNIALFLEHMNQYIAGKTTDSKYSDFENHRARIIDATYKNPGEWKEAVSRINKLDPLEFSYIMKQPNREIRNKQLGIFIKARAEAFGGEAKILDFMKSASEIIQANAVASSSEASDHSTGNSFELSLGRYDYLYDETSGRAGGSNKLSLTNNILASTVENLADATGKNGKFQQVLSFSNAEANVFSQWGNSLKEELKSLSSSGNLSKNDEARKVNILKSIQSLESIQPKIVDVKALSEQVFDTFLPNIKEHLHNNASGIRNVIEKMFGYENTQRVDQWGVDRFLHQNHSGMSVENLYKIFKNHNYQEWHTAGMDAADLGHFQLFLKDIIDQKGGEYKAPSSKDIKGTGLVSLEAKNLELFNITSKLARNIQSKTILTEIFRDQSKESIMSLIEKSRGNLSDSSKALLRDNDILDLQAVGEKDFHHAAISRLQTVINNEIKVVGERLSSQGTSYKYTTQSPSLLSKVVSSPTVAKSLGLGAYLYFSSRKAIDDPGTSIETGEHNSLETVARRIATTPFNSLMGKYATVAEGTFVKALGKRFSRGSFSSTADILIHKKSIVNELFGDVSEVFTDRTALSPAVASMKNRLVLQEQESLGLDVSSFIPKMRRAQVVITERAYDSGSTSIRYFEEMTNLRRSRVNKTRLLPEDFQDPINKQAFSGGYTYRPGFFLGSTGPSIEQQIVGLLPNSRESVVSMYGDPLSFVHRSPGLSMGDSLHHLYDRNVQRPSISNSRYWNGRKNISAIDVGSIKMDGHINLSAQSEFPSIKPPLDSNALSSYVVALKRPNRGSIISLTNGNSRDVPVDVSQYSGYIQNFRPDDTPQTLAYSSLVKAKHSPMGMTGRISPEKKDLTNKALFSKAGIQLDATPFYYSKPATISSPISTSRVNRNSSGGQYFANRAYQHQASKNAYPSNDWVREATGV